MKFFIYKKLIDSEELFVYFDPCYRLQTGHFQNAVKCILRGINRDKMSCMTISRNKMKELENEPLTIDEGANIFNDTDTIETLKKYKNIYFFSYCALKCYNVIKNIMLDFVKNKLNNIKFIVNLMSMKSIDEHRETVLELHNMGCVLCYGDPTGLKCIEEKLKIKINEHHIPIYEKDMYMNRKKIPNSVFIVIRFGKTNRVGMNKKISSVIMLCKKLRQIGIENIYIKNKTLFLRSKKISEYADVYGFMNNEEYNSIMGGATYNIIDYDPTMYKNKESGVLIESMLKKDPILFCNDDVLIRKDISKGIYTSYSDYDDLFNKISDIRSDHKWKIDEDSLKIERKKTELFSWREFMKDIRNF